MFQHLFNLRGKYCDNTAPTENKLFSTGSIDRSYNVQSISPWESLSKPVAGRMPEAGVWKVLQQH